MKYVIGIIGVLIVVAMGLGLLKNRLTTHDQSPPRVVACTEEAMVCPDGTSVGRTGPNCEFTPCPDVLIEQGVNDGVALNETKIIDGFHITPLEILEDSRCPIDVTCVQAGTVRVRTQFVYGPKSFERELILGKAISAGWVVTLKEVRPEKRAEDITSPSDYHFIFSAVPLADPSF